MFLRMNHGTIMILNLTSIMQTAYCVMHLIEFISAAGTCFDGETTFPSYHECFSLPARDNCVRDAKTGTDSSSDKILHCHYLYDCLAAHEQCKSVDSMTSSVSIVIPQFHDGIRCEYISWRAHTRYIRVERSRRFKHAFDWTFALRETTSLSLYRSGETNQRKMY